MTPVLVLLHLSVVSKRSLLGECPEKTVPENQGFFFLLRVLQIILICDDRGPSETLVVRLSC